jgi:lipopolysaccharide export system permease protein
MQMSLTLSFYIARLFLIRTGIVLGGLLVVLFLGDSVEMLRQHAARETVSAVTAIGLSLLKLPNITEKALPIAVLIGAMWAFTTLNRQKELVIARASGVSAWQFLAPAIIISMIAGVFVVLVYNPLAATMFSQYARMEAQWLRGQTSMISVSETGLWLRQAENGNQSVLHALRIDDRSDFQLALEDVTVFAFEGANLFDSYVTAETARLDEPFWRLENAQVTPATGAPETFETLTLPTSLTRDQIRESFASPETLSVFELPQFIQQAEEAGLTAARHKVHWYTILATPALFLAMVMIAATFSLRTARMTGFVRLAAATAATGFGLFFIADVAAAMGQTGVLPAPLAAWAPTIAALLFGTTALLHLEDG